MEDTETLKRILNPLVLNLQKMELELKCPTCLKLLDMPTMLPCTHIFCSQCIPVLANNECPSCKSHFLHQDTRPASHLKSLVQIFKEMSHVVATTFRHQKSKEAAETMMVTKESPVSGYNCVMDTSNEQLSELQMHASKSLSQRGESNGSAMQKSKKRLQRLFKEVDSESGELLSPSSFGSSKDIDGYNSDCANRQPGTGMLKKQKMSAESKPGVKDEVNAVDLEYCQKSSHGTSQLDKPKTSSAVKIFKCMFCHSRENTEGSGPMVHFVNGKDVGLAGATHPNAFHVHEKCYQWSPQIYYANETLVNLEVELARASKIKCSKCNVKGAALGCYVKTCRRSYHVPCAYAIYDVRWDCENFLMLCPYHSSKKLPCDKSKSKSKNKDNHSLDFSDLPDQTSTPWNKDWVFCCSALSKEERLLLEKFACISGATVIYYWDSTVSHVIASVNDSGGYKRTSKVLMSILTGKWILTMEWVKACLEAGKPVPEEQYEVTHDVHGCFDGPKTGRLRALQKEPKLFEGLNFYVSDDFHDASFRQCIVDLVLAGGGNVIALDDLSHNKQVNEKAIIAPKPYILYSAEVLPDDCHELMKRRTEEAEALAAGVGGIAIPHSKFLDNVAACEFLVI